MPQVRDYTALLSGSSINGTSGAGAFVSFSFPDTVPDYLRAEYSDSGLATFRPFSEVERVAARSVVQAYAAISGIVFFEVASQDGDIKFMNYNLPALGSNAAGFAYYPDNGRAFGFEPSSDIFIHDASGYGANAHILLHELGHALGLKHSFDGPTSLAPDLDNFNYTVMSYDSGGVPGDILGPLDVDAIRALYGDATRKGTQVASWVWDAAARTLTQNGGDGADSIFGIGGGDIIHGGGGGDTIVGREGSNQLHGDAGDDFISGGNDRDELSGGDGNDRLIGGTGGDRLDGGAGDDLLSATDALSLAGGDGRDVLTLTVTGAGDAFTLDGGAGADDSAAINAGGGAVLALTLTAARISGIERLSVSGGTGDDRITLDALVPSASLSGNDGNDVLRLGDLAGAAYGGAGDDRLYGGAGNDTLSGGSGMDQLFGGGGNDNLSVTLSGSQAGFVLDVGDGDADAANITFSDVVDRIVRTSALPLSGIEQISIAGGGGNDQLTVDSAFSQMTLYGNGGDDVFRLGESRGAAYGGDGADTIHAGTGFAFLYGGVGADRFVFASLATSSAASGIDQLEDFQTGVDRIDITALNPTNVRIRSQSGGNYVQGDTAGGLFQVFVRQAVSLSDIIVGATRIDGTDGPDTLTGTADVDIITAGAGNDSLSGLGGDDTLLPGPGRDIVDGGAGEDIVVLAGNRADYVVLNGAGQTFLIGTSDGVRLSGIEQVRFADASLAANALGSLAGFDALRYIASHTDLIAAFGIDTSRAIDHFVAAGFIEGRAADFDALRYIASYPDLIAAFGADTARATLHYIQSGFAEGRAITSFDPLQYLASNPDLARVIGNDPARATLHYITDGLREGRVTSGFDALLYGASNPDVAIATGGDPAAMLRHYLDHGADEGRATASFDPLEYAASNPDLARYFGLDAAGLAVHYVHAGIAEGRVTTAFDPLQYAAANIDLARVFGGDEAALTRHYILGGVAEGRVTGGFDPVAYLLTYDDLGAAGLGADRALVHWVDNGVDEGRIGDAAFGREQVSHAATRAGTTLAAIERAGDRDWFGLTLAAGQTVQLDLAGSGADGLADPFLTLFDAAGHRLASDDNNGPAAAAALRYTAIAAGIYYIVATAANGVATGSYALSADLDPVI